MPRLPPHHAEKREAALRANLMKRKEQARAREGQENPLPPSPPVASVIIPINQQKTEP